MVSILQLVRNASKDTRKESIPVGEEKITIALDRDFEQDKIILTQGNDGMFDYIAIKYEGLSKQKLQNLMESNRFFRAAYASARAEQLTHSDNPANVFPLFEMIDYGKQNLSSYVLFELDNMKKYYEDGKITMTKKVATPDVSQFMTKSPTTSNITSSPFEESKRGALVNLSPVENIVLQGKGRGSGTGTGRGRGRS